MSAWGASWDSVAHDEDDESWGSGGGIEHLVRESLSTIQATAQAAVERAVAAGMGGRSATSMKAAQFGGDALGGASSRDDHHALGEEVAAVALGAAGALAPQHQGADLPLGVILRGLDVVVRDERPERRLVLHSRTSPRGRRCRRRRRVRGQPPPSGRAPPSTPRRPRARAFRPGSRASPRRGSPWSRAARGPSPRRARRAPRTDELPQECTQPICPYARSPRPLLRRRSRPGSAPARPGGG